MTQTQSELLIPLEIWLVKLQSNVPLAELQEPLLRDTKCPDHDPFPLPWLCFTSGDLMKYGVGAVSISESSYLAET